jgi:hypothetical protein
VILVSATWRARREGQDAMASAAASVILEESRMRVWSFAGPEYHNDGPLSEGRGTKRPSR